MYQQKYHNSSLWVLSLPLIPHGLMWGWFSKTLVNPSCAFLCWDGTSCLLWLSVSQLHKAAVKEMAAVWFTAEIGERLVWKGRTPPPSPNSPNPSFYSPACWWFSDISQIPQRVNFCTVFPPFENKSVSSSYSTHPNIWAKVKRTIRNWKWPFAIYQTGIWKILSPLMGAESGFGQKSRRGFSRRK